MVVNSRTVAIFDFSMIFLLTTFFPNQISEQLVAQLAAELLSQWRNIGLQLGVDQAELDQIANDCDGDHHRCFSELFKRDAEKTTATRFPETLIKILVGFLVREPSLAKYLESTKL